MTNNRLALNANRVVAFLQKLPQEFTKQDIIRFIAENQIKMVNFMYPGGDGKLKTLNFVISDRAYLDTILTCGERVDGSSLFSFIQASASDLYVLPRFSTAFVDPFSEIPTLCLLCSYFDKDGQPLASSPEQTLRRAAQAFREVTGMEYEAMGELEYYVIKPAEGVYPANDQRGYHESAPYAKTNDFRTRCMYYIAQTGGQIKYGHSEVGNFEQDGLCYEQNEIEFLPVPVCEAADQLMIAKWVIRNLAWREGLNVTFAPKITTGKAGSGLHVHMRITKDGCNMMLRRPSPLPLPCREGSSMSSQLDHQPEVMSSQLETHPEETTSQLETQPEVVSTPLPTREGQGGGSLLSSSALRMIGGMMELAPSITAFGNKNPTSYFRLVPHQEAPTNVCWGDRNRSVLVRVPLGWTATTDMSALANGFNQGEDSAAGGTPQKQTVEMRSPDGSADIYQLLAGLCVACRHGFEMEDALEVAERNYVDVNIHDAANADKLATLAQLPDSCEASADCLERQRKVFEAHGVFSPTMIDGIISQLRAFADRTLRRDIADDQSKIAALVRQYFHCG